MANNVIDCPHCGAEFDIKKSGKPRSIDQHRRYFALMRQVFEHWPETHPTQFADATECRKWIQMKAGHRDVAARIPLVGVKRERGLMLAEAAIRAVGSYAVPVIHGDTLVIFKPKSIAFHRLSHLAFCELNNAVDEVIRAEADLDPAKLLEERKLAA